MIRLSAVLAAAMLTSGVRVPQDSTASIDRLAWMAGCWEGRMNGRQYREHWMTPAGDAMMGVSQTVANGKTEEYEFLQIRQEKNGVYYVARPSGQAEAGFRLVESGSGHARFENAEHDFPQRIIYRLQPHGGLLARVEGRDHGIDKGFDYPMMRAPCD